MISADYRIGLVAYIKHILGKKYHVFDGAMTFAQEPNNYTSYFLVNEETKSLKNYEAPVYHPVPDKYTQTHNPLKKVDILIDVRGTNSFIDARMLSNSFYVPEHIEALADLGLGFLGVSGIASLPHLKNDYQEEGYTFTLSLTFDASFEIDIAVIKEVNILYAYAQKCKESIR